MGLQIWLPLNGNINNQGIDNIEISNNLATVNAAGKIGSCYSFNNSTSYIDLGDISKYFDGSPFTICFWIKSLDDKTRGVIFSGYGLPSTSNFFCIEINSSSTNYCNNNLRFDWNGSIDLYSDADFVTYNSWIHIAVVYDGAYIKMYRDGVLLKSFNRTGNLLPAIPTGNSYYLGRDTRTGTTALNGYLNDFRLYDEALSEKKISEIARGLTLHYSLSNRGFGEDNLLRNSLNIGMSGSDGTYKTIRTFNSQTHIGKVEVSDTEHSQNSWRFVGAELGGSSVVQELTTGENTYTFSCDVKVTNYTTGKVRVGFDFRTSSVSASTFYTLEANEYDGNWHRVSMQITTNNSQNTQALWGINTAGTVHGSLTVIEYKNPKLERGSHATPWVPNSADTLYSSFQLGSTTEFDLSGYQYNGIKNNISNSSDSIINKGCYVFNGTNSWVKCDTNAWMVQGATEFTVNWWGYAEDWTAVTNGGRMVSCTESGGFNIEGGASGYLRFPRYVYTNADKTTRAYQYSNNGIKLADLTPGWHMFTMIYTLTGEQIYIDGELHSSASYTSYGISFNTGARLFLGCEANGGNPGSPYFNGKLADYRFYYTALDEDAIKELYEMGVAR